MWGRLAKGVTKGHKENLRGDGYVYYLDCSNGFMRDMYIKTSICIH